MALEAMGYEKPILYAEDKDGNIIAPIYIPSRLTLEKTRDVILRAFQEGKEGKEGKEGTKKTTTNRYCFSVDVYGYGVDEDAGYEDVERYFKEHGIRIEENDKIYFGDIFLQKAQVSFQNHLRL